MMSSKASSKGISASSPAISTPRPAGKRAAAFARGARKAQRAGLENRTRGGDANALTVVELHREPGRIPIEHQMTLPEQERLLDVEQVSGDLVHPRIDRGAADLVADVAQCPWSRV
jgi:hypothetical protein